MKVLLTTSGIGSRLGDHTKYNNKSLVRVGDQSALSRIIEYYPKNTNFVITLGHFGDYVKQYLNITYPDRKFEFVWVKEYTGPKSSLGYSMLQAKSTLQEPFIFHACDTILTKEDTLPALKRNWVAGSQKGNTSHYRTIKLNKNIVEGINEKGEISYDYVYIGVCGIKDYKLFWEELEKIQNFNSLSDTHVINKMISSTNFNFVKINKWLDTGNVEELAKTREYFNSCIHVLDKPKESIYLHSDFVVKFFADKLTNTNRIKRSILLKDIVPKITHSDFNFYRYKKIEGNILSECVTEKSFLNLLQWSKDKLWILSTFNGDFKKSCNEFYYNKTKQRIQDYLNNKRDEHTTINGEKIPPIHDLVEKIDFNVLCDGIFTQIHGDFILDNIIQTDNGFTLIDWRQDFSGILDGGDIYYDLAKLNHNLTVNHNIVSQKLYNENPDNCYILCNSTLMRCKEILKKFIIDNNYNYKKVSILTAIIWINMAPLHEYPFNKFLFNFGKYNLFQQLKNE